MFSKAALLFYTLAPSVFATVNTAPTRDRWPGTGESKAARKSMTRSGRRTKSTKSKKGRKSSSSDDDCIKRNDIEETIDAFASTVVTVSDDFEKDGCQGAFKAATLALDGAYAYNFGDVLFKPTVSSVPYTNRPEYNGALSYFIGTRCMYAARESKAECGYYSDETCVFPKGNKKEDPNFIETGFGLGFTNGLPDGWASYEVYPFEIKNDGPFCNSALAMGQICWTKNSGKLSCVDKTFSFVKGDKYMNQQSAVITSHHSSEVVSSGTQTECQNTDCDDDEEYNPENCPNVGECEYLG